MQHIRDIIAAKQAAGKPAISFEFFPFKTEKGEDTFFNKTLPALKQLNPDYCSVTYGAGGSTRDKTLEIVQRIQDDYDIPTMAHLTCVCSTREQIGAVLDEAKARGIQNILALRGDPPDGGEWTATEGGFEFSYQLIEFIRDQGGFSIGCAGFPEGHIASEDKLIDWKHLKGKFDAGAEFALSQLFFDNADFFRFTDHLRDELGATQPIVPGIIPILNGAQIQRFTAMCGARLPEPLLARLQELGEDDDATMEFGIDYAATQCRELLDRGAPGIHFYTLNKAAPTTRILEKLGIA